MSDPSAKIDLDIFGNPVVPPAGRGRPRHQPTPDSRLVAATLASLNKRSGEIAAALNISEPTLRKNYRHELDRGSDQIRAEIHFRAMQQVRAGNVSAMKFMRDEMDRADLAESKRQFDGAEPPEAPQQPRLGKRESAQIAARLAGEGNEWGDDLTFPGGGHG